MDNSSEHAWQDPRHISSKFPEQVELDCRSVGQAERHKGFVPLAGSLRAGGDGESDGEFDVEPYEEEGEDEV